VDNTEVCSDITAIFRMMILEYDVMGQTFTDVLEELVDFTFRILKLDSLMMEPARSSEI
jgi:hypothetical protein